MGIWEELRLISVKLFSRNVSGEPVDTVETRSLQDIGFSRAIRYRGAEKLKEYVPDPDRREKIGRILTNIGKFAVDSAVKESLKGVTGGIQVYKIVKEGWDYQSPSQNSNESKKPDITIRVEEMQARMEKIQEEMDFIKQQSKTQTKDARVLEPLNKFPDEDEPVRGSVPPKTDPKRVFIRSRL
ncbi:hypothetical protein NMG60_11002321 [Bertholletia excelsa]